jgi:acyl dehydratase
VSTATTVPAPPAPLTVGPLTRTDFVRYQGASGDMQPVHHDEEVARAAGHPSPFSVGMYQAGVLGSWLVQWFGAENVRRYRVRFTQQVWPGDVLTCTGNVTEERPTDAGLEVDVALTCSRGADDVVVQAWATCVVPARTDAPRD